MENSIALNEVKVLALDFDGVVTNLDIDWHAAIRLASTIVGYDIKSLITFYDVSYGKPVFQTVSEKMEQLELEAIKEAKLVPFIGEFLQELSEMRVETYIVSMQSAMVVEKFLSEHALTPYFKGIVTREKYPSKNAQVSYVIEKAGVCPNQVLLVDDSARNISKCKELGVVCFHFTRQQNPQRTREMWKSILDIVKGQVT
jgi:phosphoglycolate phosphatase-like HAD superfamily hydrolase